MIHCIFVRQIVRLQLTLVLESLFAENELSQNHTFILDNKTAFNLLQQ